MPNRIRQNYWEGGNQFWKLTQPGQLRFTNMTQGSLSRSYRSLKKYTILKVP